MITVSNLTKVYSSPISKPGFLGFFENLFNRKYKSKTAVNNISFTIGQGEFVGFLGPNGAGKTTTLKMLTGILYPTKGKMLVNGFVPFEKKNDFLKQIAFVMGQRNQLLWELPATDTFLLNKTIYGISDEDYARTLDELVDLLDVREVITQPAKTLSLGQRMKMELIASLIHNPKILFLDEPTIGLDVVAQSAIRDFLKEYQTKYKATIILTSHYMEDIKQLCKRVLIIDKGAILYDGKLESMIKKYAKEKEIVVTVTELLSEKQLAKVPSNVEIVEYTHPRLVIRSKKSNITSILEFLTNHVPFSDLTVEDERIETIIKRVFESAK